MKTISIVSACFNEEANVEPLYLRVAAAMATMPQYDYEHIFIDNASTDATVSVLKHLAAADPQRDRLRITANVEWLERAQIQHVDPVPWPGSWSYLDSKRARPGDNSNTQFAVLGLWVAKRYELPVQPVLSLLDHYYRSTQSKDGAWSYKVQGNYYHASMTCAGLIGLAAVVAVQAATSPLPMQCSNTKNDSPGSPESTRSMDMKSSAPRC